MIVKTLGFELRKVGSLGGLYKEVDMVLDSHEDKAKSLAVAHGIHKMFKPNNHFDICFIRNASEMCNIVIPAERLHVYQAAHCMDWNDMLPDYRQIIMAMVMDDFRSILNPNEQEVKVE